MNSSLIEKLTIVEFASVLAGPLTGTFFAELGAKVIKIENPGTGGDITRGWRSPEEDKESGVSAYYASANYGKDVRFLDLNVSNDKDVALELCKNADVVISNFKPSSAIKLGITYDQLISINPSVIFAEIQGYPEGHETPAFDVLLQAQTGYLSMTGFEEMPYAKIPVAMIDILASHQLREGILIALMERMKDGKARKVSTNLYGSALSGLINQASDHLMNGRIPGPLGSKHPNIAPYGDIFYTKDEKAVVLAIGTDRKFEKLLELLGLSTYLTEFHTNHLRVQNREKLNEVLSKKIEKIQSTEFLVKLHDQGIPCSLIYDLHEIFQYERSKEFILAEERDGRKCFKTRTVAFNVVSNH